MPRDAPVTSARRAVAGQRAHRSSRQSCPLILRSRSFCSTWMFVLMPLPGHDPVRVGARVRLDALDQLVPSAGEM